ncbi:subtilisin-like protein [Byssothecium circinans]|uniref:Subtilisin-like protein n=1 Tax=Byssothecium circinans TaxID=147558 RepID=A0A6A5U4F9_9PLEO|nr:subtilisin-like protein [Byssothecium circinans]
MPGGFYESASPHLGTMFFFLHSITDEQVTRLKERSSELGIQDIYVPFGQLTIENKPYLNPDIEALQDVYANTSNVTEHTGHETTDTSKLFQKRGKSQEMNTHPALATLSWDPESADPTEKNPIFFYDDSMGEGTFLYSIDFGAVLSHNEFTELRPSPIRVSPYPPSDIGDSPPTSVKPGFHGTCMMAIMAGKTLGTARKATITFTAIDYQKYVYEHFIDALLKVYDDIKSKENGEKAIVNMSLSFLILEKALFEMEPDPATLVAAGSESFADTLALIIRRLIEMGVVVVTGSGNQKNLPVSGYPAKFKDPNNRNHIPDLIVAGSTTHWGSLGALSQEADYIDIWAPGDQVRCTNPPQGEKGYRDTAKGTSIASARVAGLAAYLRGLNPNLKTAREVADLIKLLGWERPRRQTMFSGADQAPYRRMAWNGQTYAGTSPLISGNCNKKRQNGGENGDSCLLPDGGTSLGKPLTFSPGAPSPQCSGPNCGSYCTGFFCSAPCSTSCGPPPDNPTQTRNPDFLAPANPDSCQNKDNLNFGNCDGPKPIAPPCRTTTSSGVMGCATSPPSRFGELKDAVCNKASNDHIGEPEINPTTQRGLAETFCISKNWIYLGSEDSLTKDTLQDSSRYSYYFDVQWIK